MQRCQNNGNDVFYSFLCYPLDIFAPNLMVFRAHRHSPSPRLMSRDSHLSHSHVLRFFTIFVWILKEWSRCWNWPIVFLERKVGEVFQSVWNSIGISGRASAERLFSCSGLSCKGKKTNVSSVLLESQTLCRFNKKFHINL